MARGGDEVIAATIPVWTDSTQVRASVSAAAPAIHEGAGLAAAGVIIAASSATIHTRVTAILPRVPIDGELSRYICVRYHLILLSCIHSECGE